MVQQSRREIGCSQPEGVDSIAGFGAELLAQTLFDGHDGRLHPRVDAEFAQDRFDVNVLTPGNIAYKKTQVINPTILKPSYTPQPWQGYTPGSGGISSTPGQTNPAYRPNYTGN